MNPTQKLIEAAEAVCDRWDSPLWKDAKPTADYIAALREAVRGLREAGEPVAGWKLVPVEPTQAMCQEGQWKAQEWPKFPLRIAPIWKAMLAAAPPSPAPQPAQDGASK